MARGRGGFIFPPAWRLPSFSPMSQSRRSSRVARKEPRSTREEDDFLTLPGHFVLLFSFSRFPFYAPVEEGTVQEPSHCAPAPFFFFSFSRFGRLSSGVRKRCCLVRVQTLFGRVMLVPGLIPRRRAGRPFLSLSRLPPFPMGHRRGTWVCHFLFFCPSCIEALFLSCYSVIGPMQGKKQPPCRPDGPPQSTCKLFPSRKDLPFFNDD